MTDDGAARMHPRQLRVDVSTVSRMVGRQFPQWRELPIAPLPGAGTVSAVFRIGEDLAARFPLLADDPAAARRRLDAEASATRELARVCTVPVPAPVAVGVPDEADDGYPMPWTVHTWLPGHDATFEDPAASVDFAHDLADLLAALRSAPTHGRRFAGTGRGGQLPEHDEWLEVCFRESEQLLDVPLLRAIWAGLRTLPHLDADVMCHGDLTPPNVLTRRGRLTGVLDGGGYGPTDPALDLVAAWHLLDEGPRDVVRSTLGCSDLQWQRGMAWAFEQAMGLVWYYAESNPGMSRWGRRTLDRVCRVLM